MTTVRQNFIFLTPAEERQLLKNTPDKRDYTIIKLILDTGLMMRELRELKISDIDFNNKILKVTKTYTNNITAKAAAGREIPLNDELCLVLKEYLQLRGTAPLDFVFITSRGRAKQLSHYAIEDILKKAQARANLAKRVNAHNLRNTFAVKLCLEELPFETLSAVLGLHNGDSIQRYVNAGKNLKEKGLTGALDVLDKRSAWKKFIDRLHEALSSDPPLERANNNNTTEKSSVAELIGQETLLRNIKRDLEQNLSVIIIGERGSGKSALLEKLTGYRPLNSNSLKEILQEVLKDQALPKGLSTNKLLAAVPAGRIIPLDNIDKMRESSLELIKENLKKNTFILTARKLTPKLLYLKNMLELYRLENLSDEQIRTIAEQRLANTALGGHQKEKALQKIVSLANGNPGLCDSMLTRLEKQERITDNYIAQLYVSAPGNERNWSILLFVAFSLMIALRYIARGTQDTELYLLSGISYSFLIFWRNSRRRTR